MKKSILYHNEEIYMGITIREFQVAMETYGAERLSNCSIYSVSMPCFNVAGTNFLHSSSYYIVQREKRVSEQIMNRAMAEFGEKYPGGKNNFWFGEIHSIKGLLTIVAMLDGKYSRELVNELTNETYKKSLDCASIKSNVEFPFHSTHSPKMEELYRVLAEYSNIVNPFGNSELRIKDPIQYLDAVEVTLAMQEGRKHYTSLNLSTNSCLSKFHDDENGFSYDTFVPIQKNRINGYIDMSHYYTNGSDGHPVDQVVRLYYKANRYSHDEHLNDIDLRISLKTGLAWKIYKEEQAELATDEQIEVMITHLKISIKKIKNKIVRNMINM